MTIAETLSGIKVMSASAFANITETDDSELYFVEKEDSPDITEYASGTSGYIIFPNGMCIQWGQVTATTSGTTVSLTKTYANSSFTVVTGYNYSSRQTYATTGYATSASNIKVFSYSDSINSCWITIGQLASGQY